MTTSSLRLLERLCSRKATLLLMIEQGYDRVDIERMADAVVAARNAALKSLTRDRNLG